jgi:hypothetical protein
MPILKYLSTAKRNPVTRIRFYQNSVMPIDITCLGSKEYKLVLSLDSRFIIEFENNSDMSKDYVFTITDEDGQLVYISDISRIESKSFYRITTRQKTTFKTSTHKPYFASLTDHKTKLNIFYRNSHDTTIIPINTLKDLKGFTKIFGIQIAIDSQAYL